MKPTRNELAVHEAGHAYAFAALTRNAPKELGLAVDRHGRDHGWSKRREVLNTEVTLANLSADVLPYIRWQAAAEVVIAIAGPIADARYRMRNRGGACLFIHLNATNFLVPQAFDVDGDFQRIRGSLDYIGAPDPAGTFARLIDTSDEILASNWPAVQRLAHKLRERGVIGKEELEDWFEADPAKPWRGELDI